MLLINVKIVAFVGILTFMSMINVMFSQVEYEKSFIKSWPDLSLNCLQS